MKSGKPVHLTPKEFDLLHYLMTHAGLPVTHARLLHMVWGVEYANQVEYLRTFMRQLRKKLKKMPATRGTCSPKVISAIGSWTRPPRASPGGPGSLVGGLISDSARRIRSGPRL